jgi:hypothetical protein
MPLALINTDAAAMNLATTSSLTIGVGRITSQEMTVEGETLQKLDSTGLTLGSLGINKGMKVANVTALHSNSVSGVLTMIASTDDSLISFETAPSTFFGLAAQADAGITVQADLTTTSAQLYLDADYDNSVLGDTPNTVIFADGRLITAKTVMTLESTTSSLTAQGTLTLQAGTGIVILDNMNSVAAGKAVVINSDFENAGDGTSHLCQQRR